MSAPEPRGTSPGRFPRGKFEAMVPGFRWNVRGNAYAYFLTDRYPPRAWG